MIRDHVVTNLGGHRRRYRKCEVWGFLFLCLFFWAVMVMSIHEASGISRIVPTK